MLIKSPLANFPRDGLLRHDFVIRLGYGDNIAEASKVIIEELTNMSISLRQKG